MFQEMAHRVKNKWDQADWEDEAGKHIYIEHIEKLEKALEGLNLYEKKLLELDKRVEIYLKD